MSLSPWRRPWRKVNNLPSGLHFGAEADSVALLNRTAGFNPSAGLNHIFRLPRPFPSPRLLRTESTPPPPPLLGGGRALPLQGEYVKPSVHRAPGRPAP